ncbi:hypothetical protein PHMEG_00010728 [Phytophthora megakarya]|uniref:Uncharacterized protein n=1 Tax=Phytophthora megakarya TaxID=4795 RepID=A0A225WF02_9STRA|nr:hypothetical protein PHMEG_00010728 [Phytophthora megakarya]
MWLASHYPDTIDSKTNKMCIPLPKPAVLGLFGHICSPAQVCDRDDVDAGASSKTPLSPSALVDIYRTQCAELDPNIDTELSHVLEGYEKVINNLKKRGLMTINEGKRELKASGFDLLALKLMTLTPTKKTKRGQPCCLDGEQGYKGDQTGADKFGKHVYATLSSRLSVLRLPLLFIFSLVLNVESVGSSNYFLVMITKIGLVDFYDASLRR